MKRLITPIGIILVTGLAKAQVSSLPGTENYIQTKTYLDYNGTQVTKSSETVQYFDGLGRAKQVINIKASPLGKDIVTHIEYDQFGRQVKEYLPIPQQGTQNGTLYTSPLGNASSVYGNEKIFSEKVLENSPLDRIQKQFQVGNDWNGKPVNFEYQANTVADGVRKFTTTTSWVDGATKSDLGENWLYTDGQLYKNTVMDEDGNKTIEFKNGKGQTVVIRKVVNGENADTHYVYNEYDQLAFVIPPLASIRGDIVSNTTKHDELCYQYRYDGKNRLVEKKLPGKGWEYMVYDKQDRLVATRDANLKAKGQWLYTKYDKLGRAVITGISTGGERTTEQTLADLQGNNSVNRISTPFFNRQGMDVYYDNPEGSYPKSPTWVTLLSLNYYDSYPGYSFNPPFPSTIQGETTLTATLSPDGRSTNGLPLLSIVKNIEDDKWTKSYTYYDLKGRAIGTYSINHFGGYTQTESKLDFAGLVQNSEIKHLRKPDEEQVTIKERFEYDAQNRLLKHYHQVDFWPEQLLAENTYNELSQLTHKKVGNNLQNIDYAYNIRGWLSDINKDQMSVPDLGGKLFSYKIKYTQKNGIDNPDPALFAGKNVQAKYNGNIAEVDWRTVESPGANPPLNPKRYGYAYDGLNRLTAGYYQNPNNPSSKENIESLSYDLNGNITSLYRTGITDNSTTPTVIDNLTYTYTGNQAIQIKDDSNNKTGYEGIAGLPIEYDLNGNMKSMMDKQISAIGYNHLNLPNTLEMVWGQKTTQINTKYRADGIKISKENITADPAGSWEKETTDYLDGFQYLNKGSLGVGIDMFAAPLETQFALEQQAFSLNAKVIDPGTGTDPGGIIKNPHHPELQFFPTSEGFYDYQKKMYIYQYKDHLGNVRLSYGRSNSTGLLEITDINDYYPFGMNHLKSGNAYFGAGSYKNYKYQGQELQETGFYSFKWRNYMPDVGRFFNIDPLSEKYAYQSHYNFAENRVIDGRELEGLEWVKSTTLNDNGTKTYILSATINLVNRSQNLTPEGVEAFKTNFVSQMKESFNGTLSNGDTVEIGNISYVDKGPYTVALVDKISSEKPTTELDNGSEIKGYTLGENGNSQANFMEAIVSKEMTPAYATHEVGHSLGLKHQDDKSNPISPKLIGTDNLMSAPQWKIAKQTIPEQKQIIIQNIPDEKNKN